MISGNEHRAHRLMSAFNLLKKTAWHKAVEGYKPSELKVLFFIKRGAGRDSRGVTVSEISSMMGVTSPTVTPLVRSLEDNGLVIRYNDQEDRRLVRVKLTEEGDALTRRSIKLYTDRFEGLYDYLGDERSDQLADLLELVFQYMEEQKKQINE
ncbi:putative HTH-type transcriptional regulator YusO [compost metagenome]